MPDEIEARLEGMKGVNRGSLSGFQGIGRTCPDSGRKSVRSHGAHVPDHSELEISAIANRSSCREAIDSIAAQRLIVVSGVRLETSDRDMIVVS